jgi:DNA adenine methylase
MTNQTKKRSRQADGRTFLNSPLRYPGGKFRAVQTLAPMAPKDCDVVISPFIGGGNLELHWAQEGKEVIAYDGFGPLVEFWQYLLDSDDHPAMMDIIKSLYPLSKEQFYALQKLLMDQAGIFCAAYYFVLNRGSFSGTTLSGGCGDPSQRFSLSAIARAEEFSRFNGRLTVCHSLWPNSLEKHPDEFMYLDPPYMIKDRLYGHHGDLHEGFDHAGLAAALKERSAPWLLSYNDSPEIRELYQDFTIQEVKWGYGMGTCKKGAELVIKNY